MRSPHEGQQGIVFKSERHKLVGTLFLAPTDTPKPTAVLLHGLPGIEKNYDAAHALRAAGWNALIFHYRGCWGSEGPYSLATIPIDVRSAIDELGSRRYPQVDPLGLVLIGHSLGGWAAVISAANDERVRAVAVYGGLAEPRWRSDTVEDIARNFIPWLNGVTAHELAAQYAAIDDQRSPLHQVHRLAPRPLLLIHGGRDEDIPARQAEALFERAREPRELRIHPEANHAFTWHRPWLRDQILGWLGGLDPR
jgi:pimeloyl-ACP methyl ester carboxylesterase